MAFRDMMDQLLTSRYATLALLGVVVTCVFTFSKLRGNTVDPKEPALLKPRVPFIGHILGLLIHKIEYIGSLG
jgi:hypothetical protein